MLFWAIIVHFNRSVTLQCNVALDGLVNFHICIVWANFTLGSNSVKGKAQPNILYKEI